MNVLLTSAGSGRRVRLVKAFIKSLQIADPNGKLIIVDENPFTPGLYISGESYLVPKVTSRNFNNILLQICSKKKIDWIIPTTDADIYHFAKNIDHYEKAGIKILTSHFKSIKICNDKKNFYEYFNRTTIPVPKSYFSLEELRNNSHKYPLIIKPLRGFGTKDTYILKNDRELNFFYSYVDDPFLQEYIIGKEFTIDVLLDLKGKPISVVPRERKHTRAGVSDVGITIKDQNLIDFGCAVAKSLEFIGPINIQCILQDNGKLQLIEVNPRFSGGISLTMASGADFALWTLKMLKGHNVKNHVGDFLSSMTMMVYEESCNRLKGNILKRHFKNHLKKQE